MDLPTTKFYIVSLVSLLMIGLSFCSKNTIDDFDKTDAGREFPDSSDSEQDETSDDDNESVDDNDDTSIEYDDSIGDDDIEQVDDCSGFVKYSASNGNYKEENCGVSEVLTLEDGKKYFVLSIGRNMPECLVSVQLEATGKVEIPLIVGSDGNTQFSVRTGEVAGYESLFDSFTGVPKGGGTLKLEEPQNSESKYDLFLSVTGKDTEGGDAELEIQAMGTVLYVE